MVVGVSKRLAGVPRLYVWSLVLFVIGLSNLSVVLPVVATQHSLDTVWLQAIAGVVLIGGSVFVLVRGDPDEFDPNPLIFWIMVLLAALLLAEALLNFVG